MDFIKTILLIKVVSITGFCKAQDYPTFVVENGYTYTIINTKSQLTAIGFDIDGQLAASKGRRAKRNYKSGLGKGGCYCSIKEGSGDSIYAVAFSDENGNELSAYSLMPYFNEELNEVIFR